MNMKSQEKTGQKSARHRHARQKGTKKMLSKWYEIAKKSEEEQRNARKCTGIQGKASQINARQRVNHTPYQALVEPTLVKEYFQTVDLLSMNGFRNTSFPLTNRISVGNCLDVTEVSILNLGARVVYVEVVNNNKLTVINSLCYLWGTDKLRWLNKFFKHEVTLDILKLLHGRTKTNLPDMCIIKLIKAIFKLKII